VTTVVSEEDLMEHDEKTLRVPYPIVFAIVYDQGDAAEYRHQTVPVPYLYGDDGSEVETPEFVELTLAQVGQLFAWAWSDADAFLPDTLSGPRDVVTNNYETAETLRRLLEWSLGTKPPKNLTFVITSLEEIVEYLRG